MRSLALLSIVAACARPAPRALQAPHAAQLDPRCATAPVVVDDSGDHPVGVVRSQRTIAAVDITGAGPELLATLQRVVTIQVGDELAQDALAGDVNRMWALGVLSDVRVDVAWGHIGAEIAFAVTPRPVIDRVVVTNDDVELRRLRWLAGALFEPSRVARLAAGARTAYVQAGHLDAAVTVKRVALPGNAGVELCVAAAPGPRVQIGVLRFPGHGEISERELTAAVRGAEVGINHPGGLYDAATLDEDRASLTALAYEHGLLEVRVDPPRAVRHGDTVDLEIPIHEGAPYRLRRITVVAVGGARIPLGIAPGDLFVRSRGLDALDRISHAIGERAAVVEPELSLDREHHLVDVTFHIEWRQPWHVLHLLSSRSSR